MLAVDLGEQKVRYMVDTIAILAPDDDMVSLEDLYELTGKENVRVVRDGSEIVGYDVTWDDVQVAIRVPPVDVLVSRIDDIWEQVEDWLADRHDKKAKKILRRAERMIKILDCTITPDWDEDRKAQHLVQGIMESYDYALMVANGVIYNENGNIEIGPADSKLKYWQQPKVDLETGPAIERKKRSIKQLKHEEIPFIPHLPVIPDESLVTLRSTEEAAQRAIVLSLISRRAEGQSYDWFQQKVQQYELQDVVTEDEWEFAEDDEPPEYIVIKFSQRLESCWLLLWALGFVDRLNFPNNFAPPERAYEVIDSRSAEQFLLDANLRHAAELLDMTDLYYRYHWALVDAELFGKKPPRNMLLPVIYERHYALNWLTGYKELPWDEVSTDT